LIVRASRKSSIFLQGKVGVSSLALAEKMALGNPGDAEVTIGIRVLAR
jgi:hypothetical protein